MSFLNAIGDVISKIVDYIPGRKESIRNKIDNLKRERDELLKKPSTYDNVRRATTIAIELRKLGQTTENY